MTMANLLDDKKIQHGDQHEQQHPLKDVIGIKAQIHPVDAARKGDQPTFPQGLFDQRHWDIGRDFESLVEIGRGKYVQLCASSVVE